MKAWFKKQFTLNLKNLKAIGIGFLWAIGITLILGLIGINIPAIGITAWVIISYKYQKKFAKIDN